jgi:IclR family transcriptional regulator, KDG regulon repressor
MVATRTPSVASVRRALSIIEILANAPNGMGVTGVSRKIHAPKSSTHTILLTLARSGFLQREDRTGNYILGLKILTLGSLNLDKTDVRTQAQGYLHNLVEHTGLTAHLAVLDGNQLVYVDKMDSPGMVKMNTWVGRRIDAHCTALGKALLASLPADRFDELYESKALAQRTVRTISSRDALRRELQRIRVRGYAVDDEECGIGVRCVGSTVFDREGKAAAAIGLSGTTAEISRERLESLGKLTRGSAGKLSRILGFTS